MPDARAQALTPVARWNPARKRAVLLAIREGHITVSEAMAAHHLTEEELQSWFAAYEKYGRLGLRQTATNYRRRA